jgi:hypothetical protein
MATSVPLRIAMTVYIFLLMLATWVVAFSLIVRVGASFSSLLSVPGLMLDVASSLQAVVYIPAYFLLDKYKR